jgi:hypothetical protein
VQTWTKTFEQSDARAAERFKGEAVRTVLSAISDDAVSDMLNASAFYAAYKLANYSSENGFAADCAAASDALNPCTGNVELYAKALILNGSTPASLAQGIAYSEAENNSYTIGAWRDRIAASASMLGFNVSFSEPRNFVFRQYGPWSVNASFDMDMNISDFERTMSQSKALHASASFPIDGFPDPMIARGERAINLHSDPVAKQIWRKSDYNSPSDVRPIILADNLDPAPGFGVEGNGWFFGPITDSMPGEGIFEPGSTEEGKKKQYIFVSDFSSDVASVADLYGAVLLTVEPVIVSYEGVPPGASCAYNVTEQTRCLNCMRWGTTNDPLCDDLPAEIYANETEVPVTVATNLSLGPANPPPVRREGMGQATEQRFLLLDNSYNDAERKRDPGAHHRVWDITLLRDMAICGFYLHDENAPSPSFLQRMLAGAPMDGRLVSQECGIESFVVGKWAGGALDCPNAQSSCQTDPYSKLDWEFYRHLTASVYRIKGMMGCKEEQMCTGKDAITVGTGKFRLTLDSAKRYDAKKIIFNDGQPVPN